MACCEKNNGTFTYVRYASDGSGSNFSKLRYAGGIDRCFQSIIESDTELDTTTTSFRSIFQDSWVDICDCGCDGGGCSWFPFNVPNTENNVWNFITENQTYGIDHAYNNEIFISNQKGGEIYAVKYFINLENQLIESGIEYCFQFELLEKDLGDGDVQFSFGDAGTIISFQDLAEGMNKIVITATDGKSFVASTLQIKIIGTVETLKIVNLKLADKDCCDELKEAPKDGTIYGRIDAKWEKIESKRPIGDGKISFKINGNILSGTFTTNQGENVTIDFGTIDYNSLLNRPDLSVLNDVLTSANFFRFPVTGDSSKVYIAEDTGYMYRWNGSSYTQLTDQTAIWGQVSGTLANQSDLQNALNAKFDNPTGSSTDYIDGTGTPTAFPIIPTVGNGQITLKIGNTILGSWFANKSSEKDIDIASVLPAFITLQVNVIDTKSHDITTNYREAGGEPSNHKIIQLYENDKTLLTVMSAEFIIMDDCQTPQLSYKNISLPNGNYTLRIIEFPT